MRKVTVPFLASAVMLISLPSGLLAQAPGQTAPAISGDSLLISPGDVLNIQFADSPDMDQHSRVTDAGTVPVIGAGAVAVTGLTPEGAGQVIAQALINAHYMNHPQVLVSVDQYSTRNVSVLGEVKNAGAFPIDRPRPVLDVLALAGGLTPIADRHILIERDGHKQNPIAYYVSNSGAADFASEVMVNPGDTIFVPRAGFVYILGDVNHPGAYALSNNEAQLTCLQAVSLAGGLTKTAKQGQVRLLKPAPDGQHTETKFSFGDMQQGKIPDVELHAGDILYVPFSYGRNLVTNGSASITSSATSAAIYALP